MMLTDTEWLRFVSFGVVAGGALGAGYTGALASLGRSLPMSIAGAVVATGVIALLAHLFLRHYLNREVETATATTEDTETT